MIDAHREVATNVLVKYYYEEDGDDYLSVLWGTDEDQIEFWICFCIQTMTTSNWSVNDFLLCCEWDSS